MSSGQPQVLLRTYQQGKGVWGAAPSPGHQAGAPLRRHDSRGANRPGPRLPPAIRPGLHCGSAAAVVCAPRMLLPPAIRPGLHCGNKEHGAGGRHVLSSPGHQAGAPLRQHLTAHLIHQMSTFPRPSGRGSIAALRASTGTIRTRRRLPPAIRPGLHCGASEDYLRGEYIELPPAIRPGLHCGL